MGCKLYRFKFKGVRIAMNWGIFLLVCGIISLIVSCAFNVFFIFCIFKVGADSERKEEEYEETKYEVQSDL